MAKREFTINSDQSYLQVSDELRQIYLQARWVDLIAKTGTTRTNQQRKAIEVYCRELARALNDAGFDQRQIMAMMKEGACIPWGQESVKDSLWRPLQVALLQKESTTDLERDEVSKVYDVLNNWVSSKTGIYVPFPDRGRE
jgi:hypothetical protein